MQLPALPLEIIDWDTIEASEHPGVSGFSRRRVCQFGEVGIRMVELSPGYLADHWCDKGHVIHCLEGEVEIQIHDGRAFTLRAGMTCRVGDAIDTHRGHSRAGAKLFLVD